MFEQLFPRQAAVARHSHSPFAAERFNSLEVQVLYPT
jgi:hypothetical protein